MMMRARSIIFVTVIASVSACGFGPKGDLMAPDIAFDPYVQASPGRHISKDCSLRDPDLRYNRPTGCLLDEVFTSQIAHQPDVHHPRSYNGQGGSASNALGYAPVAAPAPTSDALASDGG